MATAKNQIGASGPPDGVVIRRPTRADFPAITALISADETRRFGEPLTTLESQTARWSLPGLDPQTDTWVACDREGRVVAEAWVWALNRHTDFWGDLLVSHDLDLAVFGPHLLALVEGRARELALPAPVGRTTDLGFYCPSGAPEYAALFGGAGYAVVRHSFRMIADPSACDTTVPTPAGIDIRPLDPACDGPAVHAALEEGFVDHFRNTPEPYQHFLAEVLESPTFDPTTWLVAWDGTEVAAVLGAFDYRAYVDIDALAVRKPWRGRGVAKALLSTAFALFAARGRTRAGLYVDATNATGAVQLYTGAGMRIAQDFELWLRPIG